MFDCNFAFHWMQIFHWTQIGGIEMSRNTSPAFQLNPEFPPSALSLWRLFLVCNVASLFCHVWEVRSLKIGFWMEEWSTLCINYMGPSTEVEVTIKTTINLQQDEQVDKNSEETYDLKSTAVHQGRKWCIFLPQQVGEEFCLCVSIPLLVTLMRCCASQRLLKRYRFREPVKNYSADFFR